MKATPDFRRATLKLEITEFLARDIIAELEALMPSKPRPFALAALRAGLQSALHEATKERG